jgi:hypothetical protein
MHVVPYPDIRLRRYKVAKHVFRIAEKWWEAMPQGIHQWHKDWNNLRVLGLWGVDLTKEHPILMDSGVADILDRYHSTLWMSVARRVVEENHSGIAKNAKSVLRSQDGFVVVCWVDSSIRIITCYRD